MISLEKYIHPCSHCGIIIITNNMQLAVSIAMQVFDVDAIQNYNSIHMAVEVDY